MATSTLGSGTLVLAGTTSGTTTVTATAVAGTTTLTLPAATDTLVGKATTDTLTNKTLTGAVMNGTLGATTPSTVAATTLTTSSTVTHNGGTANGVAYLNGSKVLTTGSALVFDGTNLGLGVTPSAWVGYTALQVKAASVASAGTELELSANCYYNGGWKYYASNGIAVSNYEQYNGTHLWRTAASGTAGNAITFTEAMTLNSSGNLLVGATTNPYTTRVVVGFNGGSVLGMTFNDAYATAGNSTAIYFARNASVVGTIVTTLSATAYNTSSDYRLKNTIAPMTGALAKVAALKPVTYKWNVDGSDGEGFIAHELAEVVPQCVTGEKDAVDADGNPKYQGIDTSFLVATLTAAIQEQQALITQLTARITALESA
jgi:hypothetical protein